MCALLMRINSARLTLQDHESLSWGRTISTHLRRDGTENRVPYTLTREGKSREKIFTETLNQKIQYPTSQLLNGAQQSSSACPSWCFHDPASQFAQEVERKSSEQIAQYPHPSLSWQ